LALTPRTRIGAYEITAQIGVGGMGEVYLATDSNLKRSVAIKVLPASVAGDADRLARFQREAEVLAALNHPNIAAIYGLEKTPDLTALVMEFVEGDDLSQRIARGAIPIEEALPIAKQIADALEAAHEQGIIHRDLKPANIKLRPDGTVKVLDFGLAKAMEPAAGSSPSASMSPTLSIHATQAGIILGTAAYMAPEQARGKAVDKRADVWAFGAVLFEMLTGSPPFPGEDISHILARVIERDPDWSALPTLSPTLGILLRRCLTKDPRQRMRDIGDVRLALDGAFDAAPATTRQTAPRRPLWQLAAVFSVAALVIGGTVVAAGTWLAVRPSAPQPVHFAILPTATQPLTLQGFQRDIAITPDGRNIVYRVGPAGTAGSQLVVRSLDQLDARLLPGISGIRSPFISPDGHWIGFFEGVSGGELKKVSILGGPPITLCKFSGNPLEASWGPNDTIIFADNDRSTGLLSVAASGGEPKVLTKPDPAHGELDHAMPFILPGGRAVLFTILAVGQPSDNAQIAVLDLKTGQKKTLIRGGSDARYVDTGHLVYAAAGTVRAVRFDLARLEVTSDPVPMVEQVAMSGTTWTANFVLSNTGTLVYVPGIGGGGLTRSLVWVTRQGREEAIKAPLRAYTFPRISPDGTRVAFDIRDQENDIWVWDLTRETLTRVTFDPGLDRQAVWTPDSRRLLFSSSRGGAQNLYAQAADNTGTIERLTTSPNPQVPLSMSPDGTRVLFMETTPKTGQDISMLTLAPSPATTPRPTQPLIQTAFNELNAEVSPDGQWVAYQSNESGVMEVYVRPFPKVDTGHWQVSTGGGSRPLWGRNGRELFYYAFSDGALMAVSVHPVGALFSASNPSKIFDTGQYFFGPPGRTYDVSADGQRFLMIKLASTSGQDGPATSPSLVVVEHWTEELKARVPTK
jgi:serine/threonine-protein kinase